MVRPGPVERIRARLAARAGPAAAARLPAHYQRLGTVVLVRWPEALRPEFGFLAPALAEELGVETVARLCGPVEGSRREPRVELLSGATTETEVREDGITYRFDAARILYSRGNRTERARMARFGRPGEEVLDLFAGIGYFALPIARHGGAARVVALEENPRSFRYLEENIRRNRLGAIVAARAGDNRALPVDEGAFDRVLLGYLPDARPWIPLGIRALRRGGGTLHVHWIEGARVDLAGPARAMAAAVEALGRGPSSGAPRVVKAYGPGRVHAVVDLRVGASTEGGAG